MAQLAVIIMCPSERGPPAVTGLFASKATKRAAAQNYDNTKIAVARILGGEERTKTKAFLELQSHYLFADKFGRPGKGNDKGDVEGLVGYARRNFMVPIPSANSWDELNAYLAGQCRKRRERLLRGHTETIGERFERDRAAMLPLPAAR